MCFAIPYRVTKTNGKTVTIEDGREILLGPELTVTEGMYIEVQGNVAVSALTKNDGDTIRQTIKKISKTL